MTSTDPLVQAREALARGDLISSYDLATAQGEPEDRDLAYVEVRALAGLGDWRNALRRYRAAGIAERGDVDSRALEGRLLKDAAFAAPLAERPARFAEASAAYAAAIGGPDDFYAPINAAATAALAGDPVRAADYAQRALAALQQVAPPDYWAQATRAEALLLLGRVAEAEDALRHAPHFPGATVTARASTYRQLNALAAQQGLAMDLASIRPPRTAHFCGHMFRADAAAEARIAQEATAAIAREGIGWAFGALASGSDIVIAEACLAAGVELHVVLPFDEDDFLAASVLPAGAEWLERYRRCRNAASRTYAASAMRYVVDPNQFAFGSEVAMGLARLRAAQVGSEAVQLAVWDGVPSHGVAGTGADVARWRASGGRTVVIDGAGLPRPNAASAFPAPPDVDAPRALRVMVFTDFKGFSGLPEAVVPAFWRGVMGRCADVLAPFGSRITSRNTWGDALYLSFDEITTAAEALVSLSEAMAALDLAELGLPAGGGMRIAAHFGAVYEVQDPVTHAANYYGSEVSRAARVEPVTPPAQVWVTEPMAAAVALNASDRFACRYVGRIALAKNHGTERIYRLERVTG